MLAREEKGRQSAQRWNEKRFFFSEKKVTMCIYMSEWNCECLWMNWKGDHNNNIHIFLELLLTQVLFPRDSLSSLLRFSRFFFLVLYFSIWSNNVSVCMCLPWKLFVFEFAKVKLHEFRPISRMTEQKEKCYSERVIVVIPNYHRTSAPPFALSFIHVPQFFSPLKRCLLCTLPHRSLFW